MNKHLHTHLQKAYTLMRAAFVQLKFWFLELPRTRKIMVVAGIFFVLLTFVYFSSSNNKEEVTVAQLRQVEVINVGEASNISTPLSLVGKVESVSEATVRAESSGQLTRVYKKLGDIVFAGQTIAEFENSGERAGVVQAEGAYEQAKAVRDIATINNSTSANSLDTAKSNAINILSSAYSTMDDIVRGKTDIAFSKPENIDARFIVLVPNQALISTIESTRVRLETLLQNREAKNKTTGGVSDIEKELDGTLVELQSVKTYLDDLASAYNGSLQSETFSQAQLDAQKTVIGSLRGQIIGTIASVTGVKQSLLNAQAGDKISSGYKNPSTASSDASVKVALGAYQAALSRLQKTIVTSPISGTINSLSLKTGDYIGSNQQIAVISNNNALEVTTYISSDDIKRVRVGQVVILNERIKGVVTRVASGIDSTTRKIEVKIGIQDSNVKITNGQSVRVEIQGFEATKVLANVEDKLRVPLSAVKMTPRGAFVFFVNEDTSIRAVQVEMGLISGDDLEIVSGIAPSDTIIKDARGLKEGMLVEVKNK